MGWATLDETPRLNAEERKGTGRESSVRKGVKQGGPEPSGAPGAYRPCRRGSPGAEASPGPPRVCCSNGRDGGAAAPARRGAGAGPGAAAAAGPAAGGQVG